MLTPVQGLKIRLMTDGIELSEEARQALAGGDEGRPLSLADYASTSGIAIELEGGIWVNAPISLYNPNFVTHPGHRLEFSDGKFLVRSGDLAVSARPLPVPSYHAEKDRRGRPYTDYAITHTDRVRISPVQGCAFVCHFCDLPYRRRYEFMPLEGLVDSVGRALVDETLPARHVLISGGVPRDADWDQLDRVYEAVPAAFPSIPVDVMMVPVPGRLDAARLRAMGINGLAINVEMYDAELARKVMPSKARLSSQAWLDFIEQAVSVFGPGRIRSLLLLGIEPLESSLRAVEELARRGCEPVLSPFRPAPATPLSDLAPPTAEFLEEAYQRSRDIAEQHGVKLGPRCIPCMHNTLTFPDDSGYYYCC